MDFQIKFRLLEPLAKFPRKRDLFAESLFQKVGSAPILMVKTQSGLIALPI